MSPMLSNAGTPLSRFEEGFHVAIKHRIDLSELHRWSHTDIRSHLDPTCQQLVIDLHAFVDKWTLVTKRPTDWFQAFKEAHLPKWLRRIWPVQYAYFPLTHRINRDGEYFPIVGPSPARPTKEPKVTLYTDRKPIPPEGYSQMVSDVARRFHGWTPKK